jgi:hypothetical protein
LSTGKAKLPTCVISIHLSPHAFIWPSIHPYTRLVANCLLSGSITYHLLLTEDLTMNSLLYTCLSVILSVPTYRIGSSFMVQIKHACPCPVDLRFHCPLQQSVTSQLGLSHQLHRKKKDQGGPHEECAKLCEYLVK